jgi:Tol biopolymer transport system component
VYEAPEWLPIRGVEKVSMPLPDFRLPLRIADPSCPFQSLYSWQDDWEYRFMEPFSRLSLQGKIAYTQQQIGNGSIMIQNPDGSDFYMVFNSSVTGQVSLESMEEETAGAFTPQWSSDGDFLTFGLGSYFPGRYYSPGWIYLVAANGSWYQQITDGSTNSGVSSISPDGKYLIWREWDYNTTWPLGIKRLDLETGEVIPLTTWWDNLPSFSPDGTKILFMRRTSWPIDSPYQDDYNILTSVSPSSCPLPKPF